MWEQEKAKEKEAKEEERRRGDKKTKKEEEEKEASRHPPVRRHRIPIFVVLIGIPYFYGKEVHSSGTGNQLQKNFFVLTVCSAIGVITI